MGSVVSVPTPDGPLGFRHPDGTTAGSQTNKNRAVYPDGLAGGRDLVVELTTDGFEESVVLPDASSPASYTEELVLPAGYTARQAGTEIEILDRKGALYGAFGSGRAFDSAQTASGGGAETAVSVRLTSAQPGLATVSVSVDRAWLAAPNRVFPVTIDPSFWSNITASGPDTFVQNGLGPRYASTELRVGTFDAGNTVARSFLRFDLGSAPWTGAHVLESHLAIYEKYSSSCTARPVVAMRMASSMGNALTTGWNNQPAIDFSGPETQKNVAKGYSSSCPADWVDIDTTEVARSWMNTTYAIHGLALFADDEGDNLGWKKFGYRSPLGPEDRAVVARIIADGTYRRLAEAVAATDPEIADQ